MNPENTNGSSHLENDTNEITPVTPSYLTGSQLAEQDTIKQNIKTKRIILALVVIVNLLVIAFFGSWIFSLTNQNDVSDVTVTKSAENSTSASSNKSEKESPAVEKYRDIGLSMTGVAYRLKFFQDGTYAGACHPDVTKPCEGLYTEDSRRPKAFLAINPVDEKGASRICTGQETPSFIYINSAGESTQACETGLSGSTLYYSSLLKLDGVNYSVVFIGETRKGQAYRDISGYKTDLPDIFSSIKLAI